MSRSFISCRTATDANFFSRASIVKQEIAKEGILPFSRFFAKSINTPYAWIRRRWSGSKSSPKAEEQSSAPAILLHWFFAMFLLAVTSGESIKLSYRILINLYTYTLVIMVGLLVAGGLLYLRWQQGREWTAHAGFTPWGGPTAAILYRYEAHYIFSQSLSFSPLIY